MNIRRALGRSAALFHVAAIGVGSTAPHIPMRGYIQ